MNDLEKIQKLIKQLLKLREEIVGLEFDVTHRNCNHDELEQARRQYERTSKKLTNKMRAYVALQSLLLAWERVA